MSFSVKVNRNKFIRRVIIMLTAHYGRGDVKRYPYSAGYPNHSVGQCNALQRSDFLIKSRRLLSLERTFILHNVKKSHFNTLGNCFMSRLLKSECRLLGCATVWLL
jgi:hypothetical protein